MKFASSIQRRRRRGFTLMELLLVLAIIGLLVAGGSVAFSGVMDNARITKTETQLARIQGYIQMYTSRQNGRLPTQAVGLQALLNTGIASAPEELMDPWGEPLQYNIPARRSTADKYDLYSKGKDKVEGTEDDIGNWSMAQ